MPARRRSNNGGGETYLERLLAEFSGCCRPEEAQRPSYRAASPAAAAAPRPGWPAPDAAADAPDAAADAPTPPAPPQTRRSSSIVSDPDTLSPRAVSLLIAAAELDKLSLGALREALAPLAADGRPPDGAAVAQRCARATGRGGFTDATATDALPGDALAHVVLGICAAADASDAQVLGLAAAAASELGEVDAVASTIAPGAFQSRAALADDLRAAIRDAGASETDVSPNAFAAVVEACLARDVALDHAAADEREAAERERRRRTAAQAAREEQVRRSTVTQPQRPPTAVSAPHVAAVDVVVAAATLGQRTLREAVDILGDDMDAAAARLARQTALPSSYFSPSFVPSTALSPEQIRAWAFQTLAARGADDAAVTDILVRVVANRTLDDISKSVESACAAPHRSGRASADVLRDLVAAVQAAAVLPPGFVNERLVASACLPPERLRGVVATALVAPEVRAEDDYYAAQEARDREANRRRIKAAADTERRRRVDELEAGASDDES